MDSLAQCSENLPIFKDKWEPLFAKQKYSLNKCQISTDNFPSYLPKGTYKIVIETTKEEVSYFQLIIVVLVEPSSPMG